MKKQEIQKIKGKTEILLGMRMVDMERWDDSMLCGFIPANKDEEIIQQELRMIERIDFDYRIATHGVFRWTYKDRVILAYQDIFQPSIAILDDNGLGIRGGDEIKDFDFNEWGNNRFDEINEQNFKPIYQQTKGFVVKKIDISRFGDLTIKFENGYRLEIFIDVSDPLNCWEFYQPGEINNIMIGGNEVVEENIDVTQT